MSLKNEAKTDSGTKLFYKEYVSGMSRDRFSKEFSADSNRLKQLYEEAVEDLEHKQGKRLPGHIKILRLFSNLAQRLNPTRRLVFGVGTASFVLHYLLHFFGVARFFGLSNLLLPIAFLSVFFLLLVELLEKSDVLKEIDLARQIQLSLLPPISFQKNNLEIQSFAHAAQDVGGDYLDIIETEKGIYVVIADVSGKGLSAALYMVRIQALVNMLITKEQPSVKDLFIQINDFVKSNRYDKTFVTGCVVFFPNNGNEFEFVRAGHNFPFLYSKEHDKVFLLNSDGFALGMTKKNVLEKHLEIKRFQFNPGDTLLLYTDGLPEARNKQGEEFGQHRIESLMNIYGSLHAKSVITKLHNSLEVFIGDEAIRDDITYTCIHKAE